MELKLKKDVMKLPRIGLEPTHLAAPEPKSGVSTNFTTWADMLHHHSSFLMKIPEKVFVSLPMLNTENAILRKNPGVVDESYFSFSYNDMLI